MTATREPPQPRHLGTLIRELRQAAGLTRQQFGRGTRLGDATLRNLEEGRHRPNQSMMDRLLTAPAMADLLAKAEREGVKIDLAEDHPPEACGDQGRGSGPDGGAGGVEGDKP